MYTQMKEWEDKQIGNYSYGEIVDAIFSCFPLKRTVIYLVISNPSVCAYSNTYFMYLLFMCASII